MHVSTDVDGERILLVVSGDAKKYRYYRHLHNIRSIAFKIDVQNNIENHEEILGV